MKSGGGKKRKKGKWREGNIKTAKETEMITLELIILLLLLWFFLTQSLLACKYSRFFSLLAAWEVLRERLSLLPRPVRAVRVTRGGLEPSAIANFSDKLDRWRHIRNQEREVQRLLQSWSKTTCIVFYNNISAGHTSLLQVYRCYWTYVAKTIL